VVHSHDAGRHARHLAVCVGVLLVAVLVALLSGPVRASAAAVDTRRDCSKSPDPCIRYCYVTDVNSYPCGVVGPRWTGTRTFSVPLSAAEQDATGVKGDPGGTGTANITMDLTNNRVCATTSWSGIDSPVVWAHIHAGAHGQPENPAVSIELFPANFLNGQPSGISACTIAPAEELYAIAKCPAQFNVVVHSQQHAAGAIRGQMGTACTI
jgi:hypothetical protein